jgi:hypothetical protein
METYNLINERIMKKHRSKSGKTTFRQKRIGDLVAMSIDGKVVYGWSLCHKKDTYNFVDGQNRPGFGLKTAKRRALKWKDNPNVKIPHGIKKPFLKFVERCDRYFQDADYKQGFVATARPENTYYGEPNLFTETETIIDTVEEM